MKLEALLGGFGLAIGLGACGTKSTEPVEVVPHEQSVTPMTGGSGPGPSCKFTYTRPSGPDELSAHTCTDYSDGSCGTSTGATLDRCVNGFEVDTVGCSDACEDGPCNVTRKSCIQLCKMD